MSALGGEIKIKGEGSEARLGAKFKSCGRNTNKSKRSGSARGNETKIKEKGLESRSGAKFK